jgi:2-haloalkanoic acid dehalogenase type II
VTGVPPSYDAVAFDLLSALLDSWSLWDNVAGDRAMGHRWRKEYLHLASLTGRYRPYEEIVAEAAVAVGLSREHAAHLFRRWSSVKPWEEVPEILEAVKRHVPIAVVTNCSEELAQAAVRCTTVSFSVVVSAERAGWYKPDRRPYELALQELGLPPSGVLYVAGSPFDVRGAATVGMSVFWHDRLGLRSEYSDLPAAMIEGSLRPLPGCLSAGGGDGGNA